MGDATTRYVVGWSAVAVVAIVGMPLQAELPPLDVGAISLYVALVAIADRTELMFHFERATASFTLIEAAITVGLLLVPIGYLVPATALGVAASQATLRAEPSKGAFNVANTSICTAAAALVVQLWPGTGPMVGARPLLAVLVGMLLYVAINALLLGGVLVRHSGTEARAALQEQLPLSAAMMIGTIAVGVLFAALWTTQPELVVFVVAPAAAVYLAGRGALRSAELLSGMRAEHLRLERVVDGASDGILLFDHTGTIQVWNAAMGRMTGIPPSQAVGRAVAEVLTDDVRHGDAPVRDRWLVDRAHDGPGQRTLESQLVDAEGVVRDVRESHALVFDERGRCTGDVVVVRDVSRQLELERLRSDFVARVSHELRTPLTPIRGFASMLLRRGSDLDAAQQAEVAERILERADHLHEVVEDLLLVTRLDRRELDDVVKVRPIDVGDVVGRCVARLRERAPKRPVTIDVAPDTAAVLADDDRLRRIVDALLDNAATYTPGDTPIEVVVDQHDGDVRIRVRDHGAGIPADQREAVFEQFHRLEDPLTMRTGGVGLGLFIARRLTDVMHGRLELLPARPGIGAEFELHLPTAEPASPVRDPRGLT